MSNIDVKALRKALGNFLTGVTIVTALDPQNDPKGFTANSFTSVSLDPALILVCMSKTASSLGAFFCGSRFIVNILSDQQRNLSNLFASKSKEKFKDDHWTASPEGCPVIKESLVVLHCSTDRMIDAGDHLIVLGKVTDFTVNTGNPLGFCRGAYVFPTLTHEAIELVGKAPRIGALLEWNNSILLFGDKDEELRFPTGFSVGDGADKDSLIGSLASLDINASVDFLFGVFEDEKSHNHIIYRGNFVPGPAAPAEAIHQIDEIPWSRLSQRNARMLRRFIEEKRRDIAGLFVGSHKGGSIYSFSEFQKWLPPAKQ